MEDKKDKGSEMSEERKKKINRYIYIDRYIGIPVDIITMVLLDISRSTCDSKLIIYK